MYLKAEEKRYLLMKTRKGSCGRLSAGAKERKNAGAEWLQRLRIGREGKPCYTHF